MDKDYRKLTDKLTALYDTSLHFVNVRAFLVSYRDYKFLETGMRPSQKVNSRDVLMFNGIPLWASDDVETNNPRIVL